MLQVPNPKRIIFSRVCFVLSGIIGSIAFIMLIATYINNPLYRVVASFCIIGAIGALVVEAYLFAGHTEKIEPKAIEANTQSAPSPQKSQIIFECKGARVESGALLVNDVFWNDSQLGSRLNVLEKEWLAKAFVVDVYLKPNEHSFNQVKVKANVEFINENQRKFRTKNAVWLTQIDKIAALNKGDTSPLVIGVLPATNKFSLYEHNALILTDSENRATEIELNPKLIAIEGEEFDVNVELIAEFNGEVIAQTLRFKLSLKPEPQITEIKELSQSSQPLLQLQETATELKQFQKSDIEIIFKNREPYISYPILRIGENCRFIKVSVRNDTDEVIDNVNLQMENVEKTDFGQQAFSVVRDSINETELSELPFSDTKLTWINLAMQSTWNYQNVTIFPFYEGFKEMRNIFGLEFDIVIRREKDIICKKRFVLYEDDSELLQLKEMPSKQLGISI